jgi:hypothetical protein
MNARSVSAAAFWLTVSSVPPSRRDLGYRQDSGRHRGAVSRPPTEPSSGWRSLRTSAAGQAYATFSYFEN